MANFKRIETAAQDTVRLMEDEGMSQMFNTMQPTEIEPFVKRLLDQHGFRQNETFFTEVVKRTYSLLAYGDAYVHATNSMASVQ